MIPVPWQEGPEVDFQGCDLCDICDNGAEKEYCDVWLDSQGTRSELDRDTWAGGESSILHLTFGIELCSAINRAQEMKQAHVSESSQPPALLRRSICSRPAQGIPSSHIGKGVTGQMESKVESLRPLPHPWCLQKIESPRTVLGKIQAGASSLVLYSLRIIKSNRKPLTPIYMKRGRDI